MPAPSSHSPNCAGSRTAGIRWCTAVTRPLAGQVITASGCLVAGVSAKSDAGHNHQTAVLRLEPPRRPSLARPGLPFVKPIGWHQTPAMAPTVVALAPPGNCFRPDVEPRTSSSRLAAPGQHPPEAPDASDRLHHQRRRGRRNVPAGQIGGPYCSPGQTLAASPNRLNRQTARSVRTRRQPPYVAGAFWRPALVCSRRFAGWRFAEGYALGLGPVLARKPFLPGLVPLGAGLRGGFVHGLGHGFFDGFVDAGGDAGLNLLPAPPGC